jgi:hypothetical protein
MTTESVGPGTPFGVHNEDSNHELAPFLCPINPLNSCWDVYKERKQGNQGMHVRMIQNYHIQDKLLSSSTQQQQQQQLTATATIRKKVQNELAIFIVIVFLVKQTIIFRRRLQMILLYYY